MFNDPVSFIVGTLFIMLLIVPAVLLFLSPIFIITVIVGMIIKFVRLKRPLLLSPQFFAQNKVQATKDAYATFNQRYSGIMSQGDFNFINLICTNAVVGDNLSIYTVFINSSKPSLAAIGMKTSQYTIISLKIPPTHQHIYVRSESNKDLVDVKYILDKNQLYEAEGDMHKYFDFFFLDKAEVDSLVLFGPNTMLYMLENMANVDIEINNDTLTVYLPEAVRDEARQQKIVDRARELSKKIDPRAHRRVNPATAPEAQQDLSHKSLMQHMPFFVVVFFVLPMAIAPVVFVSALLSRWTDAVIVDAIIFLVMGIFMVSPYIAVTRYYYKRQKAVIAKRQHGSRYGNQAQL